MTTELERVQARVERHLEAAEVFLAEDFFLNVGADEVWLRWGDAALEDVRALHSLDRRAGRQAAVILSALIERSRALRFAAKPRRIRPRPDQIRA